MPRPCHVVIALQATCMLGPWLRAPKSLAACTQGHVSLPMQACHGLDYLHMGAVVALALAVCTQACPSLGCLPMGATLTLVAACPHIWSDFLKMRVFWKMRLFPLMRQVVGIQGACPRACHAALPCIDTHSGKIGSCLFPFLCPYIHSMILEEDSSKRFGVSSIFEFFIIFHIFQLPKIIKNKIY